MRDRLNSIIYIGKAKDLRKRVGSYFMASRKARADRKTSTLIDTIFDFEFHTVRNEQEALILEGKLIKQHRPKFNIMFRDDKRFMNVRIDLSDTYPRFTTTRLRKNDGAKYFGPFPHTSALTSTLNWMNREFGLRTCRTSNPDESDYKHCNADVIRRCSAPCVFKISQPEYMEKVKEAVNLLDGKGKKTYLDHLRNRMTQYAAEMKFEKAAEYRDILQNLEKTLIPSRQFARSESIPSQVNPEEDLKELADWLNLESPPAIMECFDISNISDNHIVASMVRFKDGKPDNQNYRRYRIKTVAGQDDFASMAEVIQRRYARILHENSESLPDEIDSQERPLEWLKRMGKEGKSPLLIPDLVVVDGGKGQLSSAYAELQRLGLEDLPICGLAKQEEEVFFPGESESIRIPHDRGALKLLQRMRDEAHRVANGYNELLLKKKMRESALDDCPGISKKRKDLLLKRFGSVDRIKKATTTQIAEIPGISERLAGDLLSWLGA